MSPRKRRTITIGADVDLDMEDVRLADGRRLTDELAEEIAERAVARYRGRPSVTGEPAATPSLTVRVPSDTRAALESIAKAQGRRLADVSRDALTDYVVRHGDEISRVS
jgi:hypothetical protein